MNSEGETSGNEDEVSRSEMSDDGSFSSTVESTVDSEYGDNKTVMEKDKLKETDDNIDGWEDRTKESLQDTDGEQYLKHKSRMNLEDKMGEHLDTSDELDEDCEYLEDINSVDGSSPRSEIISEELCSKEIKQATHHCKKVELKKEAEVKNTSDLDILLEPGRRGWIREVVYSRDIDNHIVAAAYLPPQDKRGRKRLRSSKDFLLYLAQNKQFSDLTMDNFCLSRKLLGLGSKFEVSRKSINNPREKEYPQFFKVVEGSSPVMVTYVELKARLNTAVSRSTCACTISLMKSA